MSSFAFATPSAAQVATPTRDGKTENSNNLLAGILTQPIMSSIDSKHVDKYKTVTLLFGTQKIQIQIPFLQAERLETVKNCIELSKELTVHLREEETLTNKELEGLDDFMLHFFGLFTTFDSTFEAFKWYLYLGVSDDDYGIAERMVSFLLRATLTYDECKFVLEHITGMCEKSFAEKLKECKKPE